MYAVLRSQLRARPIHSKRLIAHFVTASNRMESISSQVKRSFENKSSGGKPRKVKRTKREKNIRAGGTTEEVLAVDIQSLLHNVDFAPRESSDALPQLWTEVEVRIEALSSTGDGLGRTSPHSAHVFAVPFTAPGDVVVAKVVAHVHDTATYSRADLVKTLEPSPHRDDSLVKCRYFGECSGCQFQMLSYPYQLAHKKKIIEKAYSNFSGLPSELIPLVGDTIGSPLQYGYRTKLTPHFDGPRFARKLARKGEKAYFDEVPPIGFNKKQMRRTLDIEECPISTEAVQMGLRRERARVKKELDKYSKGATLLLRESTERIPKSNVPAGVEVPGIDERSQTAYEVQDEHVLTKTCITDPKSTFTEYIGDFQIKTVANSFFQNNNSILPPFVSYIRSHLNSAPGSSTTARMSSLVDAYSGSGLFSIMLSSHFERTIGIDIDPLAISQARKNVQANLGTISSLDGMGKEERSQLDVESTPKSDNEHQRSLDSPQNHHEQGTNTQECTKSEILHESTPQFIAADASQLFAAVKSFNPAETVVILDPPRKGCDDSFLDQLLDFGPERIVYVSCNVHTQASDVGRLLTKRRNAAKAIEDGTSAREGLSTELDENENIGDQAVYEIESLRGFDFFPQTSHVESVAVLSRKRPQKLATAEIGSDCPGS